MKQRYGEINDKILANVNGKHWTSFEFLKRMRDEKSIFTLYNS